MEKMEAHSHDNLPDSNVRIWLNQVCVTPKPKFFPTPYSAKYSI